MDNLNGPTGLFVGIRKGVLRSIHCNGNCHAEIIPVDIAINNLIVMAYRVGTNQEKYVTPLCAILFFLLLLNIPKKHQHTDIQIRVRYLKFTLNNCNTI